MGNDVVVSETGAADELSAKPTVDKTERRARNNLFTAKVFVALAVGALGAFLLNSVLLVIRPGFLDPLILLGGAAAVLNCLGFMIYVAIAGGERLRSLLLLALAIGIVLSYPWSLFRLGWQIERLAWARVTRGAEPLINAIETYTREHGEPPPSLKHLVPKYIPKVPSTGLLAYPSFEYDAFEVTREDLVWYDLGSRGGKPMKGLWLYVDGPPEHAILAFTVADGTRVTDVRVDRMPESIDDLQFDEVVWRKGGAERMRMVRDLPKDLRSDGASVAAVENALGEPDGRRMLSNTAWELRIECSRGFANWDVIIYWPTRDYPEYTHGGSTERIGEWAYVHE